MRLLCSPLPSRRTRAFGLAELIIAIGVVAVLTVLAVGSIKSITTSSRSIKCIAQLKQIYGGLILYTQDYQGRLPPASDPRTDTYSWNVPWVGLWCTPSTLPEKGFPGYFSGGMDQIRKMMICPENLPKTPNYQNASSFRHYYLCNYDLMTSSGYSDPPAKLSEIQLHNTVLLFDAATGNDWAGAGLPGRVYGTSAWKRIGVNHGERVNVLWADGHISAIPKAEMTKEAFERKPHP